jgi:hypothetical protein
MTEYALILLAVLAIGVGAWQTFGNEASAVAATVNREMIPASPRRLAGR